MGASKDLAYAYFAALHKDAIATKRRFGAVALMSEVGSEADVAAVDDVGLADLDKLAPDPVELAADIVDDVAGLQTVWQHVPGVGLDLEVAR
jgi:hypothetical protein